MLKIKKQSKISKARITELATAHGKLETPFFMPDATRAVLKGLSNDEIKRLGLPAMVVNTFHLYLQPGNALIKKAGGVHAFMNSTIPLVSDSGGFQVFSLIHRGKKMGSISDAGARFKSPINGSWHDLSPKKSMQIQMDLGTDLMICLDDCPPNDTGDDEMKISIARTILWARECKKTFEQEIKKRKIVAEKRPLLIAVIQGGESIELRKYCAEELIKIGFDGYGYGARPIDKDGKFLAEIMQVTAEASPTDAIRFALGVGTPDDIVRCARMGYDLFDCVIPTREGRHGRLFYFLHDKLINQKGQTSKFYETINIVNSKYAQDNNPINTKSALIELRNYSKSYLYHLFKIKDPLGARLASLQNLEFYTTLMKKIRADIKSDNI